MTRQRLRHRKESRKRKIFTVRCPRDGSRGRGFFFHKRESRVFQHREEGRIGDGFELRAVAALAEPSSFFCPEIDIPGELLLDHMRIHQKIIYIYGQDTVLVVLGRNRITGDHDFFKGVVNFTERPDLLIPFVRIRYGIS